MTGQRESWDSYFLGMASHASTRSTCTRRQVGAIIVKDRLVCASGYNGSPPKYGHCLDGWCPRGRSDAIPGTSYDNCIAVHAEANALLQCGPDAKYGATIYTTDFPCYSCAKLIATTRIGCVISGPGTYEGWADVRKFLMACGVRVPLPTKEIA